MGSRFNRLTATDLMFLRLETDAWPCHFGGLALLEGPPLRDGAGELRLEEIKRALDARLGQVPDMRQRVLRSGFLGGKPVWVDDHHFSIDNHVHVATIPGGDEGLLDTVTEVYARLLDRDRPLWEMWILTGLSDDRLGILLKLHHSVADGLAAVAIMGSLFDVDPHAEPSEPVAWIPAPAPTWRALAGDNIRTKWEAVTRMLKSVRPAGVLRGFRTFGKLTRGYFGSEGMPGSSLNEVVQQGRLVRYVRVDLAAMKQAAHARRGKVNDVVLTLWTGGLRHLLEGRGETVAGVELVTGMATTLRSSTAAGDTIDNRVGTMVLKLPVAEAEPAARLVTIVDRTTQAKSNWSPAATMGYLAAIAGTPIGRSFVSNQKASNTIVTNVMGPPVPVYFSGARILEILPIIELVGNIGLTLCAFSYCGEMYLVVTADEQAFPDLDLLMEGMEQDWLMLSAAGGDDTPR